MSVEGSVKTDSYIVKRNVWLGLYLLLWYALQLDSAMLSCIIVCKGGLTFAP